MISLAGSSPHTRGALVGVRSQRERHGIIPAYAGSTCNPNNYHPAPPDHPRIRGEHTSPHCRTAASWGSSPHTRGAPLLARPDDRNVGIIPAYAGSTKTGRHDGRRRRDHPRIRGEHTDSGPFQDVSLGSSPHTRGARLRRGSGRRPEGIIPAYAGSTPPSGAPCARSPDHPRIRGEHRRFDARGIQGPGSSPHTRGAPARIGLRRF